MKKTLYTLLLLLLAGVGGLFFYTYHYLHTPVTLPKTIHIPKGSTQHLIAFLREQGIDLHFADRFLIRRYGMPQAGWIAFSKKRMNRAQFYHELTHAKAVLQKVTLIPGETTEILLQKLAESFDYNLTKLQQSYRNYAPYQEGVLLADSYQVPKGIDEEVLMHYLIHTSLKRHRQLAEKYLGKYDQKEWFTRVITTASVIQKESANIDEMPIVSAVIRNRLKKKMALQMDGTLNYGHYSHLKVTPKRIREDNTTYNTYRHKGLPKFPVSIVDENAIRSALKPSDDSYLYFVLGRDGKHCFSVSYKEHRRNIQKKCVKK